MDILILLKNDERDKYLLDFISQHKPTESNIKLLNVVSVNGDIPLQHNGEIVENCTEFDLSIYFKKANENKKLIMQALEVDDVDVRIGNFESILKYELANNNYHLLISGAHMSSDLEDLFHTNLNSHLINQVRVPYLTLKCDNSHNNLETVLFVGKFNTPSKEGQELLMHLKDLDDSELEYLDNGSFDISQWIFFKSHESQFKITKTTQENLEDTILKINPDLILLGELPDDQSFWKRKHSKISLVNHLAKPILII